MENLVVKKKGKTTLCEMSRDGVTSLLGALNDAKAYATANNCNVEFTFVNQIFELGYAPQSRKITVNKNSDLKRIHQVCITTSKDVGP